MESTQFSCPGRPGKKRRLDQCWAAVMDFTSYNACAMRQCLNKGRDKKYHGLCEAHHTVFKERVGRKPTSLEDAGSVITPYDPNEKGVDPGRKTVAYHKSNLQMRRGLRYWSQHVEPVLEQAMRNIRRVAGENDPSVRNLEERLAASEDRIALIRTRMQNQGTATARYYAAMERAKAENQVLHERIAEIEDNAGPIETLRRELRERRTVYEDAMRARPTQEQMAETRRELEELKVVYEEVYREKENLHLHLANAVSDIGNINVMREELNTQMNVLTRELSNANDEAAALREQILDTNGNRDRLVVEINELRSATDRANASSARVESLERTLRELNDELRTIKNERDRFDGDLTSQLRSANDRASVSSARVELLEKTLRDVTSERDRFNEDADDLASERDDLEANIEELQRLLQSERERYTKDRQFEQQQRQELDTARRAEEKVQQEAARARYAENTERRVNNLNVTIVSLQGERDTAREEADRLKEQLAESTRRLNAYTQGDRENINVLREKDQQIANLSARITQVNLDIRLALAATEEKAGEVTRVQELLAQRDGEIREIRGNLNEQERLQNELGEANAALNDAKNKAEVDLREAKTRWNAQRTLLRAELDELNSRSGESIESLRAENAALIAENGRLQLVPEPNQDDFAANQPIDGSLFANSPEGKEVEVKDDEWDNGGFFNARSPVPSPVVDLPNPTVAIGNYNWASIRAFDNDVQLRLLVSGHLGGKASNNANTMGIMDKFFQSARLDTADDILTELINIYDNNDIMNEVFHRSSSSESKAWLTMAGYTSVILLAGRNERVTGFLQTLAAIADGNNNADYIKRQFSGVFTIRQFKAGKDFKLAGRMLYIMAAVLGEADDVNGPMRRLSLAVFGGRVIVAKQDEFRRMAMEEALNAMAAKTFGVFGTHVANAALNILLATE